MHNPIFTGESSLMDSVLREQLQPYLDRLEQVIKLKFLYLREEEKSIEAGNFYGAFARCSNKIQMEDICLEENAELPVWAFGDRRMPLCALFDHKDRFTGALFRGIPAGKEINSFVLALLRASGLASLQLPARLSAKLLDLKEAVHLRVMVSLGCSHCSKMVEICQQIAQAHDLIAAEMIDATLYSDLIEQYQIKRVPLTLLNEEKILGEKTVEEMVDWILFQQR